MSEQPCLLILHAHPDDEVFRTAGIMAKYAADGARVVAVYATRGEAGETNDPDHDPEEARARLGEIREQEVKNALQILGVNEVYFLGYRDSGMKDSEENKNPEAFMNAPVEEAGKRLAKIMEETRPQVVVTYDEHGEQRYGHPDHVKCNRVAVEAFQQAIKQPWGPQKLYYTASSRQAFRRYVEGMRKLDIEIPWLKGDINFEEFGLPDSDITVHVDITAYVHLKKEALAAHRSQIRSDFFFLTIPDDVLRQSSGIEYYLRVHPPTEAGEHEKDLFEGTGIATAAA